MFVSDEMEEGDEEGWQGNMPWIDLHWSWVGRHGTFLALILVGDESIFKEDISNLEKGLFECY